MIRGHRIASRRWPAALLSVATLLGGCLSYGPARYSEMSAYQLCELSGYQRVNLTAQSRSSLDAELQHRQEDCRTLAVEIERDQEAYRYDQMYNRQSP